MKNDKEQVDEILKHIWNKIWSKKHDDKNVSPKFKSLDAPGHTYHTNIQTPTYTSTSTLKPSRKSDIEKPSSVIKVKAPDISEPPRKSDTKKLTSKRSSKKLTTQPRTKQIDFPFVKSRKKRNESYIHIK